MFIIERVTCTNCLYTAIRVHSYESFLVAKKYVLE